MSTITIVPTVEMDAQPPRVRLDVTDSGSSPAYTEATVLRVNPDGRSSPVRTNDGGPLVLTTAGAVRVGLLYDREAPYELPVTYTTVENPATVSSQVTVDETRVWLIHPGVPELSMPIELRAESLQEETFVAAEGVFWPLGRAYPVVHTDGQRKAASSSLFIATDTLTDMRRLEALVYDTSQLFLNVPQSLGFGFDSSYIAVSSVRKARLTDIGSDPHRVVELPFQVVDRPSGGTQADRVYSDLLIYANYAALQTAYPDYQSLLAGP